MDDTNTSIHDSDKTVKSLCKLDYDIFEPYVKSAEDHLDLLIRTNSEST